MAVAAADAEVRRMRHPILSTHHLVLGILNSGSDEVAEALAVVGTNPEQLRERLLKKMRPGTTDWDPPEPVQAGEVIVRPRFVGSTTRAMEAQQRCFDLARQYESNAVRSIHLLAAVLSDRKASGRRLLRRSGVDVRSLERAVLARLSGEH